MEKGETTYPVHLVGDVAQHDSGADITAIEDPLTADAVVLVGWVTLVRAVVEGRGRTVTNEAALIIDARLGTMR